MGKSYESSETNSEISFINNRKIPSYIGSAAPAPFIKPIVSRNWNNPKTNIEDVMNLKNKQFLEVKDIRKVDEILDNTYESIDHPKFFKNMNNANEKTKTNKISFDLEDEEEEEEEEDQEEKVVTNQKEPHKSPAGIIENITKQSSLFLAGSFTKNPIIRLQKNVIHPFFLSSNLKSESPDRRPEVSAAKSESPDQKSRSPVQKSENAGSSTHQKVVVEPLILPDNINSPESSMSDQIDINNRPDTASASDNATSEVNLPVSESRPSTSDTHTNSDSQVFQDAKHEELLQKLALLQRVVDDLKLKHPEKYGDVGKEHTSFPQDVELADEDLILINKLKAEQIRNKERIRNREKARHERARKSVELKNNDRCLSAKDDISDSTTTNDESKPSSYAGQRNKLSKKKEMWKKNSKKRVSLLESSGTDLSALSGDDDNNIIPSAPSDYMEPSISNYDRINPLHPHPPYSNPLIPAAAVYHPYQFPYAPYPLPPPQMINMNPNMNPLHRGGSVTPHQSNSTANTLTGLPKLNSYELNLANIEPSPAINATNIVLPSGRGKARESQRVIGSGDIEKLEDAQEKARTRLKDFIDRAESGELMDTCSSTSGSTKTNS